jgi:hypothetical protein
VFVRVGIPMDPRTGVMLVWVKHAFIEADACNLPERATQVAEKLADIARSFCQYHLRLCGISAQDPRHQYLFAFCGRSIRMLSKLACLAKNGYQLQPLLGHVQTGLAATFLAQKAPSREIDRVQPVENVHQGKYCPALFNHHIGAPFWTSYYLQGYACVRSGF